MSADVWQSNPLVDVWRSTAVLETWESSSTPGAVYEAVAGPGVTLGTADARYQRVGSVLTFSAYEAQESDRVIVSVGAPVTLPDPAIMPGQAIKVAAVAFGSVTVLAPPGRSIMGSPSFTLEAPIEADQNVIEFISFNASAFGIGWTWLAGIRSGYQFMPELPELPDIPPPAHRFGLEGLTRRLRASSDLVLECFPTAESMDGGYRGTWAITNESEASGTLPPTPNGVDIRGLMLMHEPYTDAELLAAGNTSTVWPYQRYREWVTQTKTGATGGDLTEWAGLHDGDGIDKVFYEHTPQGAPGEVGHPTEGILKVDGGPLIEVPFLGRLTHDTATATIVAWRAVPYPHTGTVTTPEDGITWAPLRSWTFENASSMDVDGVEPWRIAIQNRMSVYWLNMRHYGGALILDIRPEHLATAGEGATSFVDGVGNTISTVDGFIGANPLAA